MAKFLFYIRLYQKILYNHGYFQASALTVGCLETYRDAVCKTCDAVDHNIKSMYQLMAKCEELSKSMGPIYKLAEQMQVLEYCA